MITKVGIAGGGIMGSAIAAVNLQAGYDVVIFDLEESQLLKAKGRLNKIINEFNLSAAVKYADNISSMKDCNLIIECLTEDENLVNLIKYSVPPTSESPACFCKEFFRVIGFAIIPLLCRFSIRL